MTAVCITTSSSTTNTHSAATNHTHGHAATTRQLPSHHPPRRTTPKRAHSLPCRGPIVPRTIRLLGMPEGEAPHRRPGNQCGVCWEVNKENGAALRGHDLGCGGTEQLHWLCSPCITNLGSCPLCRRAHPLCTAPPRRETQAEGLTLHTLHTLIQQNVWNNGPEGTAPMLSGWTSSRTRGRRHCHPAPHGAHQHGSASRGRGPHDLRPRLRTLRRRATGKSTPRWESAGQWGPVPPMNLNNYRTNVFTLTTRLPFAFGWLVGEA